MASLERLLYKNVPWERHTRLLNKYADRPGWRLTYDRGRLEIMAPSYEHEWDSRFQARLVDAWAEERNVNMIAGGSTTLRLPLAERGLEPDSCFWI